MVLVQRVSRVCPFATVRGYKTVVNFSARGEDLEPVVGLLVKSRDARLAASPWRRRTSSERRETRATLLLWLSILVLIPFDLVTVDSAVEADAAAAEAPVVMRILRLCQGQYLSDPGIVRDRAAHPRQTVDPPDMPVALAVLGGRPTRCDARAKKGNHGGGGGEVDAETAAGANKRPPSSCRVARARRGV